MEAIEFFVLNGRTFASINGNARLLTPEERDIVRSMYANIRRIFPEAMERLESIYESSRLNKPFFEFKVVDRFVRCNFGEPDFLHPDVEKDIFNLEEVKCPLRNICEHEHVICKPKAILGIKGEELKVAKLYAKGCLPGEIAEELGKSEGTCKTQLNRICKKLQLKHPRWLIKIFNTYTF